MTTCAYCKTKVESGAEYITYGGLVWHSEECLADYAMENEHRIDIEEMAQKAETGVKHHRAD